MLEGFRLKFAWLPVWAYQGDGLTQKVWLINVVRDPRGYYMSVAQYEKTEAYINERVELMAKKNPEP